MTNSFTLGILETGRPPENLAKTHDSYAKMFADMVKVTAPTEWDYRYYVPLDGELPASPTECDAWLVTGSKFGAYEDYPWIHALREFLAEAFAANVPIVGICFGHQILATALGGKVVKSDKGWGVGTHAYQWDERPDWLAKSEVAAKDTFAIQAFHQDQVVEKPANASILASSDFCPIAALDYHGKALSFQGHPEFSADYVKALIDDRRGVVLPDDVADTAIDSLATPLDRAGIGQAIVAFLKNNAAAKA